MTTINPSPLNNITPLCCHVRSLPDSILRPMLSREVAGGALWEHARDCEECRLRFVALIVVPTPSDSPAPVLYFLETGENTMRQPGTNFLFDEKGSRSGIALVSEEIGGKFRLRPVRTRERRNKRSGCDIRILRFCTEDAGSFVQGDLPRMSGELVLGDNRFRLEPTPSKGFHCVRIA